MSKIQKGTLKVPLTCKIVSYILKAGYSTIILIPDNFMIKKIEKRILFPHSDTDNIEAKYLIFCDTAELRYFVYAAELSPAAYQKFPSI